MYLPYKSKRKQLHLDSFVNLALPQQNIISKERAVKHLRVQFMTRELRTVIASSLLSVRAYSAYFFIRYAGRPVTALK
jgi:hypothetical protein